MKLDMKLAKVVFENPLNVCDPAAHKPNLLHASEMDWKPLQGEKGASITAMPHGLMRVLLVGDPNLPGLSIFRLKYPAHYRVPPHVHWMAEHSSVLEGSVYIGFGDKFDENNLVKFTAGDFFSVPVGMPHYVLTKEESPIFEFHVIGPWQIDYCNPDEHPHE